MKTITKSRTKRRKITIIVVAAIAVVILAVFGTIYAYGRMQAETNEASNSTTNSEIDKDQVQDSEDGTGGTLPNKNSTEQSEGVDTDSGTSTNAVIEAPVITRASNTDGTIKVVATFQEESSGYCEIKFEKSGSQTIIKNVSIVIGPSYYACSLSMPSSSLPAGGQWMVTVVHHNEGATAESDSKPIEI